MSPPEIVANGRDPIAAATEKYLLLVEKEGVHRLTVKVRQGAFRACFAGEIAEAANLDSAILLLGEQLIRNPSFREALRKAVRQPVACDDARHNRDPRDIQKHSRVAREGFR